MSTVDSQRSSPIVDLRGRLDRDYTSSMKLRDAKRVSVLRMLRAAVQAAEKSKGSILTDEDMSSVIAREVKIRRESLSEFERGDRRDLASKEAEALDILQEYVPAQLSEDEIRSEVRSSLHNLNPTALDNPRAAMGIVMKDVMARVRGRADGTVVNRIVSSMLAEVPPRQ